MTHPHPTARTPWVLLLLALFVTGCASAREKRDREMRGRESSSGGGGGGGEAGSSASGADKGPRH